MAEEIAKYTGQNNVQDFDGYFDKVKRYPTPAGAQRGYVPMTDGNGNMILHSMTDPGSESEANANIAPLEAGPTASQAYAVGDLMVYQGQLMTVVQAIAEGGAITPGTNVMSYTVAQALMQKVPVYGMGKNLLRNAYFVGGGSQQGGGQFPINQRAGYVVPPNTPLWLNGADTGQVTDSYYPCTVASAGDWDGVTINGTTYAVWHTFKVPGYTGAGYGIDGWLYGGTLTLEQGGLKFSAQGEYAQQKFENISDWLGKPVTLSVLYADGTLATGTIIYSITSDIVYWFIGNFHAVKYPDGKTIMLWCSNPDAVIQAAKLELGDHQTLAHLENGVWVLNEVPDYEEELIKCQASQIQLVTDTYSYIGSGFAYNAAACIIIVPTPVTLRATPRVVINGDVILMSPGSPATAKLTSVHGVDRGGGCITFGLVPSDVGATAFDPGQPYYLRANGAGASLLLDANP